MHSCDATTEPVSFVVVAAGFSRRSSAPAQDILAHPETIPDS
jgi:hypothetical protein